MIRATTLNALDALFLSGKKKASKVNPLINRVEETYQNDRLWMHFQVQSSGGSFYNCFAGQADDDAFWIACACQGGLNDKPCYHGFAVLEKYKKRLGEIRRKEMDNAPYFSGGYTKNDKKPEKVGDIRI